MKEDRLFLTDEEESTSTRFVSFMGESHRYDLAITTSKKYKDKKMVINLQSNHYALLNQSQVEEDGHLEHAFNLTEVEAEELRAFLREIV